MSASVVPGGLELPPTSAFSMDEISATGETDLGWAVARVLKLEIYDSPKSIQRVATVQITCKGCGSTTVIKTGDVSGVGRFRHVPTCRVLREVRGISSEVLRARR
jgi:hypothetical protein